ncbi:NAD(P)-dependent oxidoreductase [Herbaspirillum lusitanum]|uniref:NAD-dependent epimerase/dehydratase family protein n=1 Tax=Herbaspirillum lusitanum TaxID=213312 RepID=UPI002238B996|nr:NAD(P)-dependent oxidoreductase [Herbaspirillum lusitanum]MCW5296908.1 NAD(P)-dependent oxidoreductase [Herbaspirillum lusitanum]
MIDVIVTGASGFIGQALCDRLEQDGLSVMRLTHQQGCVSDAATWNALPRAGTVMHLAGRSYVPQSWQESADFMRVNVVGTEQALAYCRTNDASLVFASAYVYGIPEKLPIRESDRTAPNNPYALSKRLAEQLCEFASNIQGVPTTVLRIFNVFGPKQRAEFLIPSIIDQVLHKKEINVLDLSPRRDYVFVEDVAEAFLKAMKTPNGFRCVNVGSGISYSVQEVIDIVQAVGGKNLPVHSAAVERRQEIPDVRADVTMGQQLLGWQSIVDFRSGIERILLGAECE